MELRAYWGIIWRRIWIPALLVAVVAGVSLLTAQTPPPTYTSTMRFTVGVKPQEIPGQYDYDKYYAWVTSEYMADDLSVIVSSELFAVDVNTRLAEMGSPARLVPGAISGLTIAEKQHRILRLTLTWGDPHELPDLGAAIVAVLEQESPKYFVQLLGTPDALITVIDGPSPPVANAPSLSGRLELPVRILLALGVGVALTFLLDYLDDSVRDKWDLEAMGIELLGQIPKK
jgi:capsular polysaccharide biosynthesis protein